MKRVLKFLKPWPLISGKIVFGHALCAGDHDREDHMGKVEISIRQRVHGP